MKKELKEIKENLDLVINLLKKIVCTENFPTNSIKTYSVLELEDILKIKEQSIYKLIKNRTLKASKNGKKYVVSEQELNNYLISKDETKFNPTTPKNTNN